MRGLGDRVCAAAFGCHAWNDAIRKNFQMWENLSGVSCVTSIDRICRPYGSPLPYAPGDHRVINWIRMVHVHLLVHTRMHLLVRMLMHLQPNNVMIRGS